MSFGIHRLWKHIAVNMCGLQSGQAVLDLAGGTGDLTALLHEKIGKKGTIHLADINYSMLSEGRDRLLNRGIIDNIHMIQSDAEQLPYADHQFDCLIIGFGLRNVTNKNTAIAEMYRVLKTSGRLIILEFSQPQHAWLNKLYDVYSFNILPKIGQIVAKDEDSYRYLSESIRMHPDQETLKTMLQTAGFQGCDFYNLTGGIVAIHRGYKV